MRHLRVSSRAQPVLWVILGLVTSVLLTVGVVWIFDPRYAFLDDPVIASILSGDYTGFPQPRSLNGSAGLSLLVAILTTIFPFNLPWFVLLLEFLLTWSLILPLTLLPSLARGGSTRARSGQILVIAIGCAWLSCLVLWLIVTPLYSTVAFLPGLSAMLVIGMVALKPAPQSGFGLVIIAGSMIGVVGSIRSGPFTLAAFLLVSAPLWLIVVSRFDFARNIALMAPVVALTTFNSIADARLYASESWRVGREAFELTHALVDTYLLGALAPIGLNEGWKGYEVGFAAARYFVPSEAFTIQSFNSFLEAANPYRIGLWAISPPSIEGFVNSLNATRAGWLVALIGALTALSLLSIARAVTRTSMSYLVASLAFGLSVIWFLGFIRNNPGHIALPLGFVSATASLVIATCFTEEPLSDRPYQYSKIQISLALVATTGLLLLALGKYSPVRGLEQLRAKQSAWVAYEATYLALQERCPILGVNLGLENAPVDNPSPIKKFPLIQLGWNSLTPLTDERLTHLGINQWNDLFARDACTYFVGGSQYAEGMTEYARDRVGGTGEFVRVDVEVEGAPEVWQWQGG